MNHNFDYPIAAICTAHGNGAIAVIRISGKNAISIVQQAWKGRDLTKLKPNSIAVGNITDAQNNDIDQCVASIFHAPHSFTGEDTVEIACHGSHFIQQQLLHRFSELGVKPAANGEFSQRAFANGKIDLAQAEGIADLIAAESKAAHKLALSQTKGEFSKYIDNLRLQLIDLAAMLELELDFSEEDVTFADREQLRALCQKALDTVTNLADTYRSGQAFKNGIPTAIAGIPNAGKSTLLNALLGDDKAIVSDIPGTTRDTIEDTMQIDGMQFRIIDTAGLRTTSDTIEQLGIERTRKAITKADIILWLLDPTSDLKQQIREMHDTHNSLNSEAALIPVITKADLVEKIPTEAIAICAPQKKGLETLKTKIATEARHRHNPDSELLVTNARHYQALRDAQEPLKRVLDALTPAADTADAIEATYISADFLAMDVREAIHHISLITGSITTGDLLQTIFSRFCIGK